MRAVTNMLDIFFRHERSSLADVKLLMASSTALDVMGTARAVSPVAFCINFTHKRGGTIKANVVFRRYWSASVAYGTLAEMAGDDTTVSRSVTLRVLRSALGMTPGRPRMFRTLIV